MRTFQQQSFAFLFSVITVFFMSSCTATEKSYSKHRSSAAWSNVEMESGKQSDMLLSEEYGRPANGDKAENPYQDVQKRIVLYDASLNMVVKEPDSVNHQLESIAEKYDGYVQVLGNYTSIIRVKSTQLKAAVDEISAFGKLKSKSISGQDVTEAYIDVSIRLENARKARERYLELLAKAENVEAALKVEVELERLNGEIESMQGRLNRFDHLSEYSTITVYMDKKVKPGVLGYIGIGLYKGIRWLFVRG